jgi:hypothetical protein
MPLLHRWILRLVSKAVLCIALMATLSGSPASAPKHIAPLGNALDNGALAEQVVFPVVRLRKLHLVRPDLIPYPIYYEIYC